ncbi:hypothetical protein HYY69_07905 [Candidatus Woesearchaeota archaeon]|nr:hypothetical protein [Candidatus Woesearchaeota archaeon]
MFQVNYDTIIQRIKEKTQLSEVVIDEKIKEKMAQLSGLISKEGAANIIANQLGVSLTQESPLKINQLQPGLKNIQLHGKVLRKYNLYEFTRGDTVGKVASFQLGDETGSVRVTLWHDQTALFEELKENDTIKIDDGYVKENNGYKEIHLNTRSKLHINPSDVFVGEIKANAGITRKKIVELQDQDNNVELLGTVVQIFDIKFYPICPECNKKVQMHEEGAFCAAHNTVIPSHSYVLNLFLDDGSDNIRAVFFKQQIQQLLKKQDQEIQLYREAPETFLQIKSNLLGEMIKVAGRVVKNALFDRKEFVVNILETNLDPEDEIKRSLQEAAVKT